MGRVAVLQESGSLLSAPIGIALVGLGGILVLLALHRSRRAEQGIAAVSDRPEPSLTTALGVGVALGAALLSAYLAVTG